MVGNSIPKTRMGYIKIYGGKVIEACNYIDSCMAFVPEWASGLPVRGDVEIGKNYGECIEWVREQHGLSVA